MNGFAMMALLSGAGTVYSFVSGVRAMACNGAANRHRSAIWMTWRVIFQGAAVFTVLAALLSR